MTALILDAGALLATDRNGRTMIARLRVAQQSGLDLRSNAMVVAQVCATSAAGRRTWPACFRPSTYAPCAPATAGKQEPCSLTRAPQTRSTLPLSPGRSRRQDPHERLR